MTVDPERPGVKALTPANRNPWYVLMTLYGEQDGDGYDKDLHLKNRAVWNAWSCQNMSEAERAAAAKSSGVEVEELAAWESMKEDVKDRFEQVWRDRNGDFPSPGLLDVARVIDMSHVEFSRRVAMIGMVFSGNASFDSATFSGRAHFTATRFSRVADFNDATFGDAAEFWHARFHIADFSDATFSGEAGFSGATFSDSACFERVTFSGEAGFSRTTFSRNEACFDYATFVSGARFESATFSGDATRFSFTKFIGDTDFGFATFSYDALFSDAKFSGDALFHGVTFNQHAYFHRVAFGSPRGEQSAFFINCQFNKRAIFLGTKFHARYPDFSGTILHEKTIFTARDECWPVTTSQSAEDARTTCATLRHFLEKQGLPEDAHFFFRREMGFAGKIGPLRQRLPYLLYGWFSNYGHSIARPLLWLIGLIVTGWLVTGAWKYSMQAEEEAQQLQALGEGLSISISSTLPFMGLMRSLHPDFYNSAPWWLDTLSATQSLLGIILLFLLGLGLRTRFRMR